MQFRQKMKSLINRYPKLTAILTILIIGLLTYSPGITNLGYYRDDWHVTWGGTLFGSLKIVDLHLTDRPLMGLIYAVTFQILGNNVLTWHIYVLVLRILGGFTVFLLLNSIWKKQTSINTLMASLFVVFPGFLQMPTASAYSNHLLGLLCGLLAILITINAYECGSRTGRIFLLLISMPLSLLCFGFMEWMMGVEGFLIIFLAIRIAKDSPFQWKWRWFITLLYYSLPTTVTFVVFYIWRIFFFTSARSVTDVNSLGQSYLHNSGEMLIRLVIEPIRGFLNCLIFSWGVPFYQFSNTVSMKIFANALFIGLLGSFVFILLHLINPPGGIDGQIENSRNDLKENLILGLIFILLAILPVIIANREVRLTDTFDRYTLLASFGVVMVVVAGFKLLLDSRQFSGAMMVILVLSMMTQLMNTQYFAEFWKTERALWWQLSWRVPDLEMDTVILPIMPDAYSLAESYEIWGPGNLIYLPEAPLSVSGEVINQQTIPWIRSNDQYGKTIRRVNVSMDFSKNLIVALSAPDRCLHVYGEEYPIISDYDDPIVAYLANYSSWEQIITDGTVAKVPENIFGEEPIHGWCYTYQKASLAQQKEDWVEIARLGDESFTNGIEPVDKMEFLPFYEAYARLGRFDDANRIGELIRLDKSISEQFCTFYSERIEDLTEDSYFLVYNICPQLIYQLEK
jgi:hypothetical protein